MSIKDLNNEAQMIENTFEIIMNKNEDDKYGLSTDDKYGSSADDKYGSSSSHKDEHKGASSHHEDEHAVRGHLIILKNKIRVIATETVIDNITVCTPPIIGTGHEGVTRYSSLSGCRNVGSRTLSKLLLTALKNSYGSGASLRSSDWYLAEADPPCFRAASDFVRNHWQWATREYWLIR